MGNVTTTIGKNVVDDITNIITQITTETLAQSSYNTIAINSVDIQVGGRRVNADGSIQDCEKAGTGAINGSVNIAQTGQTQFELDTSATSNVAIAVKNQLANRIGQYATSTTSDKSGWLSTAVNVTTTNQTNISNAVTNIITNIDTKTSTSCSGMVYNANNVAMLYCAPVNKDLNITQTNNITVAASCAAKLVFNAIADNTVLNDNIEKAESQVTNDSGGIFGFITDILYFFAFVILLIIVVAVIMELFRSGKKKRQPQQFGPPPQQFGPPPQQFGPPPQQFGPPLPPRDYM